jgi:tRNA A37 threonylcarbamoyladenosine biosynthesis protein TsaE
MARLAESLGHLVQQSRAMGRSPTGETLRGFVIEDGEAEGMTIELCMRWSEDTDAPAMAVASELFDTNAAKTDTFLPLRHAARNFDLRPAEYRALLLAIAVEADGLFGRLVAYLNDHVGRTRPTIGLALSLGSAAGEGAIPSPLSIFDRPVIRDGLLEVEGEGPGPGLSIRVTRDMALRLAGEAAPDLLPPGFRYFAPEAGLLDRLVLDNAVRSRLAAWSFAARQPGRAEPLILSGPSGAGRTTAGRAVVAELGLPLLAVDVPSLPFAERLLAARREACWHGAPLLVRIAESIVPGPVDWSAFWAGLANLHLPVPLLIAATSETANALAAAAEHEPPVIEIPEPDFAARAALWQAIVPNSITLASNAADRLAARFRFNPGRIQRSVRRAVATAAPATATADALFQASREVGAAAMGTLAQKLPQPYGWDELVVPQPVRAELELARTWMSEQRRVLDQWGFARRLPMGRGLTMLFSGPPGTGKTMAAQVLARELALDLYRVDLSRVVNKYIGETEKNLGCLFDEAQAAGAILLFDEADALFGKRSEVKDAHDRYANLEVGYLLQRMEEHDGVTILASNRARDMDEAFTRRFQFSIDFPMPDEAHRLKIWEGMFPAEVLRDGNVDLVTLAKTFQVSGGEIKNAALAAAFAAAGEGCALATEHVRWAVRREFLKSGKVVGRG